MTEENVNENAASGPEAGAEAEPTELQIINGGIEIDVAKIDGSQGKVLVRQLPIGKIAEWGRCQGDEAYLVELLCDKLDRTTEHHLANARMAEMRVQIILQQAPFPQIEPIEKRLYAIREEIAAHEAKPRWSDILTHESAAQIRAVGMRLNKKKFVEQSKRVTTDSRALLKMMPEQSASPSSSSPSQP